MARSPSAFPSASRYPVRAGRRDGGGLRLPPPGPLSVPLHPVEPIADNRDRRQAGLASPVVWRLASFVPRSSRFGVAVGALALFAATQAPFLMPLPARVPTSSLRLLLDVYRAVH